MRYADGPTVEVETIIDAPPAIAAMPDRASSFPVWPRSGWE